MKIEHLKVLNKDADPIIKEWIPAGPIILCTGCGKSYTLDPQVKSNKAVIIISLKGSPEIKVFVDFADTPSTTILLMKKKESHLRKLTQEF